MQDRGGLELVAFRRTSADGRVVAESGAAGEVKSTMRRAFVLLG